MDEQKRVAGDVDAAVVVVGLVCNHADVKKIVWIRMSMLSLLLLSGRWATTPL